MGDQLKPPPGLLTSTENVDEYIFLQFVGIQSYPRKVVLKQSEDSYVYVNKKRTGDKKFIQ